MTEQPTALTALTAGTPLLWGGDRVSYVDAALAAAFRPGDAVLVLQHDGTALHLPAAERATATAAVDGAVTAFAAMGAVSDGAVTAFYEAFAARLDDDVIFAEIAAANAVTSATASSTRAGTSSRSWTGWA
jgi:glutamate-5-semialdehyde dehydrogenase